MSDLAMDDKSVPEVRQFTCAVCLRSFMRKSDLKYHISVLKHILHEPYNALLKNLEVRLPKNWKYGHCRFNTNDSLKIWIYDMFTRDDVVAWLKLYMEENNCKFVCRHLRSVKTGKVITYQCEHWKDANREHKKKKVKGTGCKCAIHFTLSRDLANVRISHLRHNHSLTSAVIRSFRKPTEYVKQIFLKMFNNGVGPTEALHHYKNHVRNQNIYDTEYREFSINKSKMPNYDWVKYLYQAQIKGKYGPSKNHEVMEQLKRHIECLNSEASDPICKYKEINEGNFVVVIMTPLMKHICNTTCAGELIFVDGIGSVDIFGLCIFTLATKSKIGRIPAGILITSNETVDVITEALSLFLEFITDTSFGSRGKLGPLNIITDNSSSKIRALYNIFPTSRTWLCTVHVLQCVYKWLWKAENGISHTDRYDIYDQLKKIMYRKNLEDIKDGFDYIIVKYKGNVSLMKYMNQLYQKKEKWCLYFRDEVLDRSFNVNNILEHNIRTLKENILNCMKAQSPVQLISYLTKEYSEFYSDKIISFVFNNNTTLEGSTQQTDSDYDCIKDEKSNSLFTVISKKTGTKYLVNVEVGMCSCYVGCSGAYCKHQRFLNGKVGAFSNQMCSVLNEEEKLQLLYLTIDNTSESQYYCDPLLNSTLSENQQPEIEIVEVLMEHCEDIEFTAAVSDSENYQILELEQEGEIEIRKSLKHWEHLCQIMLKNPAMYISALKFFNKHLTEMKNNHSEIIPRLFSISHS